MADPPSKEEFEMVIGKLKNRKAGESYGIVPEIVKVACCKDELVASMLDLVHEVRKK